MFNPLSVFILGILILVLGLPTTTLGHVQLAYPPAIIDDDYQYTFDGSCQYDSCDSFCGRAGPAPVPLTTVSPGPLNITLNVNVKHPPYRYRVGLSSTSDAPSGFDTNILLDGIEAPDDGSTKFTVTLDIPGDVSCSPYCTLQLFDYYYFVSCANVLVRNPGDSMEVEANGGDGGGENVSNANALVGAGSNNMQQYDVPSEVMLSREATNDGSYIINATVVLAAKSWFGIAVSQTGAMIGSHAVIGLPNSTSNDTSVQEFDLTGKFIEAVTLVDQVMTSNALLNITEDSFGSYIHTLSVTFNTTDICGTQLIWAHANPNGATDVLGYHGTYRGVLDTIEACAPQSDPVTAESGDSIALQARGQDDDGATSAASFVFSGGFLGALLVVSVVGVTLR
jgi:hypothetical protein